MINQTKTKDRILDAALELFGEKGYDGVGVDQIAEKAGVKGPSIYKHFKGKEEILDVLIERAEECYEKNYGLTHSLGWIPSTMAELVEDAFARVKFEIQEETISRTRKVLTNVQFRNRHIAEFTTRHSMEGVQEMYRKIFKKMMDAGAMKRTNPSMLSLSFMAPATLMIQMSDREPERRQEALEKIKEYLDYFAKEYTV